MKNPDNTVNPRFGWAFSWSVSFSPKSICSKPDRTGAMSRSSLPLQLPHIKLGEKTKGLDPLTGQHALPCSCLFVVLFCFVFKRMRDFKVHTGKKKNLGKDKISKCEQNEPIWIKTKMFLLASGYLPNEGSVSLAILGVSGTPALVVMLLENSFHCGQELWFPMRPLQEMQWSAVQGLPMSLKWNCVSAVAVTHTGVKVDRATA